MVMARAQFPDLDLEDALPFIHHLIDDEYERYDDLISYLFNVESSGNSIEQVSMVSGFDYAVETAEGGAVPYDQMIQGHDTTFKHSKFTKGFKFTEELIEDNKWTMMERAARAMGESMYQTRQVSGAQVFNRAFNGAYTICDGQTLCSTTHPLLGGGTSSNRLSVDADLSNTSLRQALNEMEDTVDHRGLKVRIDAKWLLVPNELQFDSCELLKSVERPDTANRALNPIPALKNLEPLVWHYLDDPDAWFLVAEPRKTELWWFDRKMPVTASEVDFDTGTAKTKIVSRWSRGPSNWPGVFGSAGA